MVSTTSSSLYCKACGAANPAQATHCFACQEPLSDTSVGAMTNPLTGLLLPSVLLSQRYRILDVLNTGEVSTIYKAEDVQLGKRVVALKEIGQNSLNTPEALDTLEASRREMLLLAGLIHPNLPRIYNYFVESNRWYFVMDFLTGQTLEEYLSKRSDKRLPVEEVLDIGIQLATVLDYLHAHQVPFSPNDLKPSNILRTPAGRLYLLDTRMPSQLTVTPASSMIHSLGRTLRQLQTGKAPAGRRLRFAPPRLRKSPQSLPVEMLIQQMLDKNVLKRPISMGIVKEELRHLAAQQAPPPTTARKSFSRRTLLKIGGLVGIAGIAAASSWVTWQFELQAHKPPPGYAPGLGGTIYTFNAGNAILAVGWSPDGRRVASGGVTHKTGEALVQIWDANTGKHVVTYRGHKDNVEALTWLPHNEIASASDDSTVQVWNATTGKTRMVYRGHAASSIVVTVACSPDGRYIASGGFDQTVQVWEVSSGRQIAIYRGHSDNVTAAAWSPNGRYIASTSYDKTVQTWESASGRPLFTYTGHTDGVYTAAWSPDGKYIASGGRDSTIQVWSAVWSDALVQAEAPGTLLLSRIVPHNSASGSVQDVAWSPDSMSIATASDGVQIWDRVTGGHVFTYSKHTAGVQAVEWSPNGRYIASGSKDGTAQVWNTK